METVPDILTQRMTASIKLMTGQNRLTEDDVSRQCLLVGCVPRSCPSEAAAREVFSAACLDPDPRVCGAAGDLFLRWQGVSQAAIGALFIHPDL